MIKISSLDKYYNKGSANRIHVIDNVSLQLPENGMTAIFGRSGCGKTTLLNVIGGLDGFDGGDVTIDGESITKNTDVIRNKYIGYIFQNYNLDPTKTCFENVAHALYLVGMKKGEELTSRVNAALKSVGMENFGKRTPDSLSGGQQQRIAIARAIVKSPKIILADEPTGNLDDANTVMIMDLLKSISKNSLVLLVTHEAELVDHYCDRVIELFDGSVVGERTNEAANGYFSPDKNAVYLGQLEKSAVCLDSVNIEYYGEKPNTPIDIKIVNSNGKMLLTVLTPGVRIIDNSSEIKLIEGVYEQKNTSADVHPQLDISPLPPIEGKHYGKLFSFTSSLKSGYESFVGRSKKKNKNRLMNRCMSLFACIIIFVAASLGVSVKKLSDIDDSYNHNTFYLYTPNGDISQKLNNAAKNGEHGIDYTALIDYMPSGDDNIQFNVDFFETYSNMFSLESLSTNAVFLGFELAEPLPLVCGQKNELADDRVLITTEVADKLIESSSLSYITDYEDLIGLTLNGTYSATVVGIVESDENCVFVSDYLRACEIVDYRIICDEKLTSGLDDDEIIMTYNSSAVNPTQKVHDKVTLNGIEYEIAAIIDIFDNDKLIGEFYYDRNYCVDREQYIELSRHVGEYSKNAFDDEYEDMEYGTTYSYYSYGYDVYYTLIHTSDPTSTQAWLKDEFSYLEAPNEYFSALITPDSIKSDISSGRYASLIGQVLSLTVMLMLMCSCVYFIMRSSTMGRIKEIGIYRAIGVKSSNLVYRSFVESLLLTTLTSAKSFILVSLFVKLCLSISPYVSTVFYYPLPVALLLLVLMYGLCTICGIIPVISLLKKTPSEILAKYDV